MSSKELSRRDVLRLGGLSALSMTFASCGQSGGGTGAPAATMPSSGTLQVSDPSYLQGAYEVAMDAVTDAFTGQHSGWQVEQVAPPSPQYASTVLSQLQAGSPPDVIRIDDPQLTTYVDRDWLLPLDDVLADAGVSVDDLIPSQQDAVIDGAVYGIVKESNPRAYIYNTALYEQYDVEPATDVASFEQVLRATTDPATGNFGIGFASKEGDPTTLFIQLMPFVLGFGGAFYTDGEPSADADTTIESLEFVKMLWDDNLVPRGLDAVAVNNLLTQGKLASLISGAFVIGLAKEANADVGNALTTAPNPLAGGVTMRATAWWGVPTAAENPEAGMQYIRTLLEPDVQESFQAATSVLTATRDAVTPEFVSASPWFELIVEEGFAGTSVSYFPQDIGPAAAQALPIIGDAVLGILYNGTDVTDAMRQTQSQLEAL